MNPIRSIWIKFSLRLRRPASCHPAPLPTTAERPAEAGEISPEMGACNAADDSYWLAVMTHCICC